MPVTVEKTATFAKWHKKLKNRRAKLVIDLHIDRMTTGNFGDHKTVGDGVMEKRINYGPGYRLYYCQRGQTWILLLCGGDKSTQRLDIIKAKAIKKGLQI